jgi:hypothetical protein
MNKEIDSDNNREISLDNDYHKNIILIKEKKEESLINIKMNENLYNNNNYHYENKVKDKDSKNRNLEKDNYINIYNDKKNIINNNQTSNIGKKF